MWGLRAAAQVKTRSRIAKLPRQIADKAFQPIPKRFQRDFGNILHSPPEIVVKPQSADDVQATMVFASQHGFSVVARGHGCSSYGQALSRHIVLDTSGLSGMKLNGRTVRVGAGVKWGQLQEFLVGHGLSNNVLTANPHATIAGTLSVGGYGSASVHVGGQVDHIVSLDIVTPKGELVRATPTGHFSALFRYALCGLGQLGIVVQAEIAVRSYLPFTAIRTRGFRGYDGFARASEALLLGELPHQCLLTFDFAQRNWVLMTGMESRTRPRIEYGSFFREHYYRDQFNDDLRYSPDLIKHQLSVGLLHSRRQACNLWTDFFLPLDKCATFLTSVKPLFRNKHVLPSYYGTIISAQPGRNILPLAPFPYETTIGTIGMYCVLPRGMVEDYRRRFDEASNACLDLGGRIYLHGYVPRLPDFLERQFGKSTLSIWRALKKRWDPQSLCGTPDLSPHRRFDNPAYSS